MPDFGIGETLAALFGGGDFLAGLGGLFGGGEAAAGALGAGEAAVGAAGAGEAAAGLGGLATGADLAGALDATSALGAFGGGADLGGVAGFGAGAADAAGGALGAALPTAITVNALPGAAAGAGIGDLLGGLGGLGGAAAGIGSALIPSAGASELPLGTAPQVPGQPASATGQPSAFNDRFAASFGSGGTAPGGPSASAFAAPEGTPANPDLTSFATRAQPTTQAISSGTFDPQGWNYTPFSQPPGAAAPGGAPSLDTLSVNNSVGNVAAPTAGAPTSLAPPSGGTPAASGGGLSLDSLKTGAINSITKNPLGIALGGAGLGYSILTGQKQLAAQKALTAEAGPLAASGAKLNSYLKSGTLPEGLQKSVEQATSAAKARAVSDAAAAGLPTDPAHNTALAAKLDAIDQQAVITAGQLGQQLLTAGVAESGLSSQIYQVLAGIDQSQTQSIGKAIANMAAALNTTPGPRIQIGGTAA